MSPENIDLIHRILTGDGELGIGTSITSPDRPIVLTNGSLEARLSVKVAEALLDALQKDWDDCSEVSGLRAMITIAKSIPAQQEADAHG